MYIELKEKKNNEWKSDGFLLKYESREDEEVEINKERIKIFYKFDELKIMDVNDLIKMKDKL